MLLVVVVAMKSGAVLRGLGVPRNSVGVEGASFTFITLMVTLMAPTATTASGSDTSIM